MRAFSIRWTPDAGWSSPPPTDAASAVRLVLAFGPVNAPPPEWFDDARRRWPNADLVYTTGGGQIDRNEVVDDGVVVTGLSFETARVSIAAVDGAGTIPCETLGRKLGEALRAHAGLRHVLLFMDGLLVNAAAFTEAFNDALPDGVTVSGGLASDGTEFVFTGVGFNGPPLAGVVVGVGLCGESVAVGTGSVGGWEQFGPERLVTRAQGTTVFELDGERALDVYRRYLGDLVAELPGSALLFPLAISSPRGGPAVVRTILGIDEDQGSLRFAGDVPQGHKARLMRASNDWLLDGAAKAAAEAVAGLQNVEAKALLCISCVGRRAVLRSRIEEEVDEVVQVAGGAVVAGYYSNGEIAPPNGQQRANALLHNQTMTVTAIGER
ncbi:MAG: FIST C-terminal domain-containing protein [Gemmatimonadaceae bacterium]